MCDEIFDGYYEEECLCQEERYGEGNIWKGREYQEYKINEMEERHIKNCINMLERRLDKDDDLENCCVLYIEGRIETLKKELERRKKQIDRKKNGDIVEVYEHAYAKGFTYYGIREIDTKRPLMFPNNDWIMFTDRTLAEIVSHIINEKSV